MSALERIPVIGVVGGIGSGKSFFAQTLAKHKNVVIVDADVVGHDLLFRPEIRQRIRDRFGDEVFAEDGSIQRRSLARKVFGSSPEHVQSKADLEAIVHPPLAAELHRQITAAQVANRSDAIILDAAILLEAGWRRFCDAVVMVEVPREIRLQRVQTTRGWTDADLQAREASQWPLEKKRAAATYVIENVGPTLNRPTTNRPIDDAQRQHGPGNERTIDAELVEDESLKKKPESFSSVSTGSDQTGSGQTVSSDSKDEFTEKCLQIFQKIHDEVNLK